MIRKSITLVAVLFAALFLFGFQSVSHASVVSGYGYVGNGNTWPVYFESDAYTIGTSSTDFTNISYLAISVPGYDISAYYDTLSISKVKNTVIAMGTAEGYTSDYSAYVNISYTLRQSSKKTTLQLTVTDYFTGDTLYSSTLNNFSGLLIVR